MANLSNINNYFVVDTTGKVAIGDVSAATMPTLLTQLTLYDNTATASLVIQSGAASGKKYELGSSSTGKFQITDLDASVDRLTVDTTGKIGIGTTSPSAKLDVQSSGAWGQYGRGSSGDINVENTNTSVTEGGWIGISGYTGNSANNGYYPMAGITAKKSTTAADGNYGADLSFWVTAGSGQSGEANSGMYQRMTINRFGNVGIGTDSPGTKLELYGDTSSGGFGAYPALTIKNDNASGFSAVHFNQSTSQKARIEVSNSAGSMGLYTTSAANGILINNSGNVGIGTTNPLGKLDVYANSGTTTPGVGDGIYVGPSNAVVGMSMVYSNSGYTYSDFISRYNSSSSYMRFIMKGSATPVYAMTIRGDGDVGIGTAEPPSKLTVMESTLCTNSGTDGGTSYVPAKPILLVTTDGNGTASTNYATNSVFTVGIGGGITGNVTTEHFRVNLNGNVGIGVTPTQKLDVNGQMTHDGLVLKTGTSVYIDTIQTIDKTLSTTAGIWTNTGIEGTDIGANGSYMIQVYSNAHGTTGGAWYSMYWTGVMSWYKDASNGINASEIYLNFSGHALNSNVLQLRTVQHTSSGTPANLMSLEIKTSNTLTNAPISFRFRRLM